VKILVAVIKTYCQIYGYFNMQFGEEKIINASDRKHKAFYYQQQDIERLISLIDTDGSSRLLYQLPTGGGKTFIFSEIVKRYLQGKNRKVIVLTHRTELSRQTAAALKKCGVGNQIIDSRVRRRNKRDSVRCYVAMVETLKNRINDGKISLADIGLAIVDEAHHNSFAKLLTKFPNAAVIGVTATPLSADVTLPMNRFYTSLILGPSVTSLVAEGYLAAAKVQSYDIELNSLEANANGDFTINSSDLLYSSAPMLDLLLKSYERHSKNKRTLIFNNGILTSRKVLELFSSAGYPVRHLDNRTPQNERAEILKWFRKTKNAILTSVSLLTTGFDEPSIQSVILNRATTSLTLYHQMIGRGARLVNGKKRFTVIDLGNNSERFGNWDAEIDWQHIFENPEAYHAHLRHSITELHHIPSALREKFPASLNVDYDVLDAYQRAIESGQKPKTALKGSIVQHAIMCTENSGSTPEALSLSNELSKEIDFRIKQYCKCLGNVTRNYALWLKEDYMQKLQKQIEKIMFRMNILGNAG
jgi:superfamily II DNA or RNA helicase